MALKRAEISSEKRADRTAEEQASDAKVEAESVFAKLTEVKKGEDDSEEQSEESKSGS